MAHGKWRKQARSILATLLKRIMQSIIYKPKHGFESKRLKSLRAVIWYDMNVRVWSFLHVCDLSHVHGGPQFHPKDFCRICTEFYSGEISGWAQTLGSMLTVTHPFGDHARSRFGFREYSCSAPLTRHHEQNLERKWRMTCWVMLIRCRMQLLTPLVEVGGAFRPNASSQLLRNLLWPWAKSRRLKAAWGPR